MFIIYLDKENERKMLKNIIVIVFSVLFLVVPASSQHVQQKYAITDKDEKVILNDNGTREYAAESSRKLYLTEKCPCG